MNEYTKKQLKNNKASGWIDKTKTSLLARWDKFINHNLIKKIPDIINAKWMYDHRYKQTLIFVLIGVAIAMLFAHFAILKPLGLISIVKGQVATDRAFGTIFLAISSLPILFFVWFIKNYERTRELDLTETEQWQKEFNELLLIAADDSDAVKQNIAFIQFAEYLTGRKWESNIKANTAAIFKVISMTIDTYTQQIKGITDKEKLQLKVNEIKNDQTIKTISNVLRTSFNKNGEYKIRISNNSLEEINLSFLKLTFINLGKQLNLTRSKLLYTNLAFANISGITLDFADLSEADLLKADLSGARLFKADLSGAGLSEANLSGVDLFKAELQGADLRDANLSGAKNLEGVIFKNNIPVDDIKDLPDWFDPEKPFNGHPDHQQDLKDKSPVAD